MSLPYFNGAYYHRFLKMLIDLGIFDLPGDVLELGAFVGVGTCKLASVARRYKKRVYAVDVFRLGNDFTQCTKGRTMNDCYVEDLDGHSLWESFVRNTADWRDVIVPVIGDSMQVKLPSGVRFCFAFIDGNHDPPHVRSDFEIAWSRLVAGGVLGFDDYGHDLPQDTATIDKLLAEHARQIAVTWRLEPKQLFIQKRTSGRPGEI